MKTAKELFELSNESEKAKIEYVQKSIDSILKEFSTLAEKEAKKTGTSMSLNYHIDLSEFRGAAQLINKGVIEKIEECGFLITSKSMCFNGKYENHTVIVSWAKENEKQVHQSV